MRVAAGRRFFFAVEVRVWVAILKVLVGGDLMGRDSVESIALKSPRVVYFPRTPPNRSSHVRSKLLHA